jgi:hypothetical protein
MKRIQLTIAVISVVLACGIFASSRGQELANPTAANVYAHGQATASQVLRELADPPTRTAVRTFLRILEGKILRQLNLVSWLQSVNRNLSFFERNRHARYCKHSWSKTEEYSCFYVTSSFGRTPRAWAILSSTSNAMFALRPFTEGFWI